MRKSAYVSAVRVSTTISAICATVALLVSLSSCATKPVPIPENPLSSLGSGASAYIVFPVDANRDLATLFMKAAGNDSMTDALERTDIVWGASFPDGEFRVVARGDYPRSLSRLAFPSSKGWKKTGAKGIGSWFTRDGIDASLPANDLVCIVRRSTAIDNATATTVTASGDIETVLRNLRTPSSVSAPEDFLARARSAADDGEIVLFINDAAPWITRLLGPDITLPVEYATVTTALQNATLSTADATLYDVSISVTAKDSRTARAMLMIVRLAFPAYDVRAVEREIIVEGISVTASALVDFAKNLYF
jgi:hypothetical protein